MSVIDDLLPCLGDGCIDDRHTFDCPARYRQACALEISELTKNLHQQAEMIRGRDKEIRRLTEQLRVAREALQAAPAPLDTKNATAYGQAMLLWFAGPRQKALALMEEK